MKFIKDNLELNKNNKYDGTCLELIENIGNKTKNLLKKNTIVWKLNIQEEKIYHEMNDNSTWKKINKKTIMASSLRIVIWKVKELLNKRKNYFFLFVQNKFVTKL